MRRALLLVLLLLATSPAAAQYVDATATSPYVDVADERLVRRAGAYCLIRGEARNRSAVPLSVAVRWRGYDVQSTILETALAFLEHVPPGGRQQFEAALWVPCHRIHRIERYQLDVYRAR